MNSVQIPHPKPLDFGGEGITGSVDAEGCIIALNAYHPTHGYVTLSAAEPFPETERYNPGAVRAYRKGLAGLRGFGFRLPDPSSKLSYPQLDLPLPRVQIQSDQGSLVSDTWVHRGRVYQHVSAQGATPIWSGRFALMRCVYSQLTEGGPLPMPALKMTIRFEGGRLMIENPLLPYAVLIEGFIDSGIWALESNGTAAVQIQGKSGENELCFRVGTSIEAIQAHPEGESQASFSLPSFTDLTRQWQAKLRSIPDDRVLRRGLSYSSLMAVPDGDGVCLLTDHMLLPLSWNRDAYYLAKALLAWADNRTECLDLVHRHLHWMFEQAERRSGFWGRCYLANGKIKDAAFQLDQQLFPILELTDYVLETGDKTLLTGYYPLIADLMARLRALCLGEQMLIPTDETPADDPIALPYHFSSHVLWWRVISQLGALGMPGGWSQLAAALQKEISESFITTWEGRRLFAYATDGAGRYYRYHDANDLPLALAPAWGFCSAQDPIWRATVDFAFSETNVGGYYGGRLGSVHTRAPWPLGDIQEWIIADALGDQERAARAQNHLREIAQWDGALPEAYEGETGEVLSRHWFGWTNAAYACVALGAFKL